MSDELTYEDIRKARKLIDESGYRRRYADVGILFEDNIDSFFGGKPKEKPKTREERLTERKKKLKFMSDVETARSDVWDTL